MKLDEFITAITKLVATWQPETSRATLEAIYNEIRNSTAHELAEAIRVKDEALIQLHRHHLSGSWAKKKGKKE
jgi:hypothetical protein